MTPKLAAKAESVRTVTEQSWRTWFEKYEPIPKSSGTQNVIFSADDQEVKNCEPNHLWVIWSIWSLEKNIYYLIKPADFIGADDKDFCGYLVAKNARDASFESDNSLVAAVDVLCDEICRGESECDFCEGQEFMLVSFVGPVKTVNFDKKG